MPTIQFTHPWYLLLLPLLAAGVVYVSRRSLAGLSGSRARWATGLRLALFSCLLLALAGLQVSRPSRKLAVLFVVDRSDSVPPDHKRLQLEFINHAARQMGPRDARGVLVFGGDAFLELETGSPLNIKQIHSQVPSDHTNLAGALRLGLAALPEDAQRRIVVLSDGNQNLGDALEEAVAAAAAGVQVDVVPIQFDYSSEVLLEKLIAPSEAKIGEPFEIRLIARSTQAASGVIRLLRNGELIAQQSVNLLQGPNVITFQQSLDHSRFYTYEAILESSADSIPDNNRALGFVLVKGKPKVLIVDSNPSDARFLHAALRGQQLEVDVRPPGQLPTTLAEFQTYDSIVLSNVGAFQLTPEQMKSVRSMVRDLGAGLVMVGGENSFGPGAYRGTPIEEALPVEMEVKKRKVMPMGAVAMVLHTCEFPDGNRWARETAAGVVDVLGARDKVGVLLYDSTERWGIPLQPAANKESIKSRLYNLDPGDMPDFHNIMRLAYEGLITDAKEAAVKHIIVISDGDPSPPRPDLMQKIADARITVSTVSVFPHDGLGTGTLEAMARSTKGQFYNVRRPDEIPRIFLKEAQRVLKPAIIEEPFTPRLLPDSALLQGIAATPPLLGYVAVSPKEAPSVEVAMASQHDDPILVSWRYGLGKAVAFTSDAKNRWAAPWTSDGTYFARFWAQAIRWTVRTTSRAELDAQVEIRQQKGKVTVDVVDARGNFVNLLDIRGSVAGEQTSPSLRMAQTAPGRYEGEFEARDTGQYLVALRYTDSSGVPRIHTIGAAVPYSPEYRDLSANTAVLTALADRTGGKVYSALSKEPSQTENRQIWRHDRQARTAPRPLWPLLVLAAALLLPVDIAVRRLMVSREEWGALLDKIYAATLGHGRERASAETEARLGRLKTIKQSATRRQPESVPLAPLEAADSSAAPEPASSPAHSPAPAAPSHAESPSAKTENRSGVVWHKPVADVVNSETTTPAPSPRASETGAAQPNGPKPEPGNGAGGSSTSRLLRAKRRARDTSENE